MRPEPTHLVRGATLVALLLAVAGCGSGSDRPDSGSGPQPDAGVPDAGPSLNPLPVGVLVGSRGSDKVLRYDGAGASTGVFASDAALVRPVGITFGPDGNVYVAAGDTDHVLRFDPATGAPMGVFTSGAAFQSPRNVNFGPDGAFYLADGILNQILRFDGATGKFDRVFITDPTLSGPTSFTFGPDGNVYVVSVFTNRVLQFDGTTGALIGPFATAGLNQPHDVSFGPDGNLYVTNSGSTVIQRFRSNDGAPMGPFVNDSGLSSPLGMAWGPDGNLYVANQGGSDVRRYDGVSGARLASLVAPGAGGLNGPSFLAFLPPAQFSLALVHGPADAWTALVVSGARPGARVLLVGGTAGGSGTIAACPSLTLALGSPAVVAARTADESGAAVLSAQGRSGSFLAVDPVRCVASTIASVP
ncbi:MAG: virginiamycin B lyase family protein [Myxococcaceae bacterium]